MALLGVAGNVIQIIDCVQKLLVFLQDVKDTPMEVISLRQVNAEVLSRYVEVDMEKFPTMDNCAALCWENANALEASLKKLDAQIKRKIVVGSLKVLVEER